MFKRQRDYKLDQQLVNAIRELLGLSPLYAEQEAPVGFRGFPEVNIHELFGGIAQKEHRS